MASVSCINISKSYDGNTQAVSNMNLEIADGEFLALCGPSGCGKSTLLRMIAGLEQVDEGEIYIGERYINDIPSKDRNLAMVSQTYALYPHMTVYKNMAFGLENRHIDPIIIDKMVHRAARLLELEPLLYRKPKTLSGGQLQRVALGRAIVRNPEIFLLDEPLSNLDIKFRSNMRTQISLLHEKLGTTFIYVTHDQTEAMTMADRIAVIRDGILQQVDTPKNLYAKPANAFVAGFIGTPQMNLVEALLEKDSASFSLVMNGYRLPLPVSREMAAWEQLNAYAGKRVLAGVRPEDIHVEPEYLQTHDQTCLNAKVLDFNMMGPEIHASLEVNSMPLTARLASDAKLIKGNVLKLGLDLGQLHLFDAESELAIVHLG